MTSTNSEDKKFSREEINEIIHLVENRTGRLLNVFDLGGVLYLDDGDYTKGNCVFSAHSLFIDYEDFYWCETEDDVLDQFRDSLRKAVMEQLL